MCCSRNLSVCEMGPSKPEAFTGTEGKPDSYESFAKSEIVLALRGHPGCVQDLCKCTHVHEEKGLIVHREKLLREDIPKVRKKGFGRVSIRAGCFFVDDPPTHRPYCCLGKKAQEAVDGSRDAWVLQPV